MSAPEHILERFLSTDFFREALQTPFVIDGWRYYTDGRRMVRVKDDSPNTAGCPHADRIPGWTHAEVADWIDPPPNDAKMTEQKCAACQGMGHIVCPTCGVDSACGDCDETGIMRDDGEAHVGFAVLNGRYYDDMLALPGLQIAASDVKTCHGPDRVRFRFDGGEGIIMKMKEAE